MKYSKIIKKENHKEELRRWVVKMKFTKIFFQTLELWPKEIEISNGKIYSAETAYFEDLSKIWTSVEDKANGLSEYHQIMVWAIFNGTHKLAIESFTQRKFTIKVSKVDKNYVQQRFADSLFSPKAEYCEKMQKEYENDL